MNNSDVITYTDIKKSIHHIRFTYHQKDQDRLHSVILLSAEEEETVTGDYQ